MDIKITGTNPAGILLGCLLSAKEHRVRFEELESGYELTGQLRLQFPNRWMETNISSLPDSRSWDFNFISPDEEKLSVQGEMIKNKLSTLEEPIVLNINKEEWVSLLGDKCCYGLFLFEATFLQENNLEIHTVEPILILEKNKNLKKLFPPFNNPGFKVKFVDDIGPYYNAQYISKLLDLPLTLCNTTLKHFLSYKEGRKIIQALLNEGIKTFDSKGQKIAPLPLNDPKNLLNKLVKQPGKFNLSRYYSDRAFPPMLQNLFLEKGDFTSIINRHFSALAVKEGLEPVWNNRLLDKLENIESDGFYNDPLELLKALE